MLCVAYSVREQTGIARWLAELSGVTAQWAGEDARAPGAVDPAQSTRAAYWGLVHGQKLGATNEKYEIPLVLTREVVFTIDPGIAHTYTFTVGTTPVPVAVTALHVQADVPGYPSLSGVMDLYLQRKYPPRTCTWWRWRLSSTP
jgi:hypothetical protein